MIVEVGIDTEEPRRYQLRRDGERVVVRRLDSANGASGPEVSVDWRQPQEGIYSLLVNGASYEVFVDEEPAFLSVHLKTQTFRVRAADVRRHQPTAEIAAAADGIIRITAPIPGRVARILARPGEAIKRGAGIVVVEAMKMENELRAPRDGVIVAIEVEEGQGVDGGALLATIE